jgi:hypothetical protein
MKVIWNHNKNYRKETQSPVPKSRDNGFFILFNFLSMFTKKKGMWAGGISQWGGWRINFGKLTPTSETPSRLLSTAFYNLNISSRCMLSRALTQRLLF